MQRKLVIFGCHGRNELLPPMLWVEDLEVKACLIQQVSTLSGEVLHSCLVPAHEVEQSAHLLRSLLRPPACLTRAGGSERESVLMRAW